MNDLMVTEGVAENTTDFEHTPCLFYPSFNMLERQISYPSLSDRLMALERRGINFNAFEEKNISAVSTTTNFQKELEIVLGNSDFAAIKKFVLDIMFGAPHAIF